MKNRVTAYYTHVLKKDIPPRASFDLHDRQEVLFYFYEFMLICMKHVAMWVLCKTLPITAERRVWTVFLYHTAAVLFTLMLVRNSSNRIKLWCRIYSLHVLWFGKIQMLLQNWLRSLSLWIECHQAVKTVLLLKYMTFSNCCSYCITGGVTHSKQSIICLPTLTCSRLTSIAVIDKGDRLSSLSPSTRVCFCYLAMDGCERLSKHVSVMPLRTFL